MGGCVPSRRSSSVENIVFLMEVQVGYASVPASVTARTPGGTSKRTIRTNGTEGNSVKLIITDNRTWQLGANVVGFEVPAGVRRTHTS